MNKITNASRFLFEELVSRIQERSKAVGIAVAIVDRNGNTQYEKFFGYRDQERKLPIDEDTIFGLASVTKSFVALSIMQLVEAGKVDLDDLVSKYIPEFTNRNQKPIKVWHFLCHTAGFYPMHRTIINEIAQKDWMRMRQGILRSVRRSHWKEQRQSLSCWMPRQRKTAV
mgnify:CR=1 FL=1